MKIIKEFKEFISRGNVIDMAVGVIIGGAFTAIVNALVDNILNPLIGIITGGVDFSPFHHHWRRRKSLCSPTAPLSLL